MKKTYQLLTFIIISLAVFTFFFKDRKAEAIFFDVGQGDSYALKTNDGRVILIDGGPDWSSLYGLGSSLNYFKREIDIILVTHTHADHLTALPEITNRYRVKKIILPNRLTGPGAEALLASLNQNTEIIYPKEEMCFDFNDSCYFCVLPPSLKFSNSKDDNDLSLATYFNCAGLKVFGAGDAPSSREEEVISSKLILETDILKVSHHGSKLSSSDNFLTYIDPQLAIISAGLNNSYKHPHQELLSRLKQRGIKIGRTDLDGTMRIYLSNGDLFLNNIN